MTNLPATGTLRALRTALTLTALAFALALVPASTAGADDDAATVSVDRWLVVGPVASPAPAFAGEPAFTGGTPADRRETLKPAARLPEWPFAAGAAWPAAGAALPRPDGGEAKWSARSGAALDLDAAAAGDGDRLAWLATFVVVDRFASVKLVVETERLARVFVDGEQVAEKGSADSADGEETGSAEAELELVAGKHLVVVAALAAAGGEAEADGWSVAARLEVPQGVEVAVSSNPRRGVTVRDLLDPPQVAGVALSADGSAAAVTFEQPAVPSDDRSSWVEFYETASGRKGHTLRLGSPISGFAWAPSGDRFAFRSGGALWVGDLDGGRLEKLLERDGLGGHRWAADARSLFVEIEEEAEADERGAVRVRSLPDRWGGYRDVGSLYQVSAADGRRLRRLTAGPLSVSLEDVSPDGARLLVSRTRYTLQRPFAVGDLFELDLGTLATTPVAEVTWLDSASYSPDGTRLLVLAGPSAFDGAGSALPEGTIANEYDGQAYLYDLASGRVEAFTRDFEPAVNDAAWSHLNGAIYLRATEGEYGRLYLWEQGQAGGPTRLEAGDVDVVDGFSLARSGSQIAAWGSGLQRPAKAIFWPWPSAEPRLLADPSHDDFAQIGFGRVDDFTYTADDGTEVPGRLYYPLDFDPARKYPLIVYYYGGVVPTDRSFAGRYPKNLWAARGYAVYVLQPSGTVGYGERYAARHVNDWGERIVDEILGGVDAVVAAHPFLDGSKVGCFGGSYGGFTTLSLITRSDRFAAAISHAGISGIASYWGEGWWGYLYMATAAAGSYPWNRPDLYVDRSPLFAADKISTPLLLLHGTADPNVPPGESEQMFAALRVLGKDVEYVKIEGEQHWILTYPKRVLWWETILAWFDKNLKDDSAAWEHLWGEELDRGGP